MKKIRKSMQKTMLIISIVGLLCGAFTPTVISTPATSSVPTSGRSATAIAMKNTADGYTLQYTISFSNHDLQFSKFAGYDLVSMKNCFYLDELGKPQLPIKNIMIALPDGMKATGIRILSRSEQPIQGSFTIYPAQRPLPVGTTQDSIMVVHPKSATYLSPIPYPSQIISLGSQSDLAGQSMVAITISPLHYLPLLKKLTLTTSITFSIEGVSGYVCGDYLSAHMSENDRGIYQQMIQDMVINPDDVQLRSSPNPQPMGVSPGDYNYVIVTQESWVSAFQPLADWKTQKGVPAAIVTTSWIYNDGGYSGTNVEKIRAFVQDAYINWGATYVLLGGDTDVIPCNYHSFPSVDSDPVPNDAFYADYDSDWICEVNVGRASVTGPGNGTGQIGDFIAKVLAYETNPPLTNYATNAGFFGFDLDSSTPAEQCKINITDNYIPDDWTVTTVYDSQSGNHRTNVINTLNAGQNLVNHADHSNSDCMGTGYVNHDWLIYNSDMDSLTNGNKQSILYSMGCDPAAYDVSNSIAEHFVRNSNGGGVAFIGNSRYGWYDYGSFDTYSMGFDVHFFKSLFANNFYHLGTAFSHHKNDGYQDSPDDDYYKYIFTELTLLGDPELPVWTENPSSLVVSHPLSLPLGSSTFTVHVQTSYGTNVPYAYVCLWKGSEVYQRKHTSSNGYATFTVSPATEGSMTITVTCHNYLPSETSAQVTSGNVPPYQPSYPNPSNNSLNVPLSTDLSWTGGDPNANDTVTYDVYFGTSSSPPKVQSNQSSTTYTPGTLNYDTKYHWKIVSWDNHGSSTAGPSWVFTTITTENNPPSLGNPSPANGSTGSPLNLIWSIPLSDTEGDLFSWTIQCSNGQSSGGTSASNGTKSLTISGLMSFTTYMVWVNATDPTGSGLYTREWYTFATQAANNPPVYGTPSPTNSSTGNPLSLTWSISISDLEGDAFTWTIQCSNGQGNNATGAANGTKSLSLSGLASSTTYTVWVNATDPTGSNLYTRAWYTFRTQQNLPPGQPNKPSGNASGKIKTLYTYTTSTTDPNGDQVYYNWSWGDGNYSGWLGPFGSGASTSASHQWTAKGSYSIKVKAKDVFGAESNWSDPLPVTMPQNNVFTPPMPLVHFFEWLCARFPHAFTILRHLLGC